MKLNYYLHRTLHIISALFFLLATFQLAKGQPAIWTQYEPASSYQPITINKLTQDPFGRMWLGTTKGLFSFDGSEYNYINLRDSTTQNITAVLCDSEFVYMGFEDGKLLQRSLKSWKAEFNRLESFDASIVSIGIDKLHRRWMATYGKGLYIRDGMKLLHVGTEEGLPGNEIYAMTISEKGVVWLGTDGGLSKCTIVSGKPVITNYTVKDGCLLYTSPSPRDGLLSRMPSSA